MGGRGGGGLKKSKLRGEGKGDEGKGSDCKRCSSLLIACHSRPGVRPTPAGDLHRQSRAPGGWRWAARRRYKGRSPCPPAPPPPLSGPFRFAERSTHLRPPGRQQPWARSDAGAELGTALWAARPAAPRPPLPSTSTSPAPRSPGPAPLPGASSVSRRRRLLMPLRRAPRPTTSTARRPPGAEGWAAASPRCCGAKRCGAELRARPLPAAAAAPPGCGHRCGRAINPAPSAAPARAGPRCGSAGIAAPPRGAAPSGRAAASAERGSRGALGKGSRCYPSPRSSASERAGNRRGCRGRGFGGHSELPGIALPSLVGSCRPNSEGNALCNEPRARRGGIRLCCSPVAGGSCNRNCQELSQQLASC